MSYNRLRASDYTTLLDGLPFRKIIWDVTPATQDDIAQLSRVSEFIPNSVVTTSRI